MAYKNVTPNVMISMPPHTALDVPPLASINVARNAPTSEVFGPFARPNPSQVVVAKSEDSRHRRDPNEVDPRIIANIGGESDDAYDPDLGSLPAKGSFTSAPAATVAVRNGSRVRSDAASTAQIVLIEPDTDEDTGACKATEVGSSSNVLVGG
jgi:hypothetical protein